MHVIDVDPQGGSWRGVTVMLGEMENTIATSDAKIERRSRFEAMLELNLEA